MPWDIKKEKLINMYRTMVRIRTFEERVLKEFAAGSIPGFVHLYSGEEAVATGACANLESKDYITSTHRGHGHLIAKGGRTDKMMAVLRKLPGVRLTGSRECFSTTTLSLLTLS